MRYIKIEFTKGLQCQAYQEVDAEGIVVNYKDMNGNILELPLDCESSVLEDSPELPEWGIE